MAFQKLEAIAGAEVGTHIAKPATLVDLVMPHIALAGSTENLIRSAAYGVGGYLVAKKKITGNFFG